MLFANPAFFTSAGPWLLCTGVTGACVCSPTVGWAGVSTPNSLIGSTFGTGIVLSLLASCKAAFKFDSPLALKTTPVCRLG